MKTGPIILMLAALSTAKTFCRCEDQKDLSYLLFTITDSVKKDFEIKFPKAEYDSACSYCSKLSCQYKFEKENSKSVILQDLDVNCFKRESSRDMFVIYGFIALTVGLLVYGILRQ